MSGSVFSAAAVAIVGLAAILITGAWLLWLVPMFFVVLLLLFLNPVLGMFRGRMVSGPEPSGVPSTTQASYDPQAEPRQRS